MKTTKLEMNFRTEFDKKHRISVSEADELLSKDQVIDSMDQIIAADVFQVDDQSLRSSESARYVTTTITEIF